MNWPLALQGLGVVAALMTLVWLVSIPKRDVSIIDSFWGLGFVLLAWFYQQQSPSPPDTVGFDRAALVPILVTLWGLRLAAYITWRNHGEPEDYRYAAMREKGGAAFRWTSLLRVFWLQAVLLWVVAMPLLGVQLPGAPRDWTILDGVALLSVAIGLFFETVGDWQMARFRADPAHRGEVMDRGLWRYTRHPNYFGDAAVWWGFGLFGLAAGAWWSVIGPVLITTMLLKVSGVALLEKGLRESKPKYAEYERRTSSFFPLPPKD